MPLPAAEENTMEAAEDMSEEQEVQVTPVPVTHTGKAGAVLSLEVLLLPVLMRHKEAARAAERYGAAMAVAAVAAPLAVRADVIFFPVAEQENASA